MSGPRMGITHLNGSNNSSSSNSSSNAGSSNNSSNISNPRNRSNNTTVNLINRVYPNDHQHHPHHHHHHHYHHHHHHHQQQHQHQRPLVISSQHDELIKYHYDSWTKISQEVDRNSSGNGTTVIFYQEQETPNLKDFEPFNLEAYWSRRCTQSLQQLPKS